MKVFILWNLTKNNIDMIVFEDNCLAFNLEKIKSKKSNLNRDKLQYFEVNLSDMRYNILFTIYSAGDFESLDILIKDLLYKERLI